MIINKKELLGALEIVKPGLANREIVDQATSFAFMKNRLVTFNDKISISHPIPELELTGAIKADIFYKFLQKVNFEEIELSITDGEVLLESGKSKAGFTLESEIKLPIEQIEEIETWFDLPSAFLEAIKMAGSCCMKPTNNSVLSNIHVNEEGYIEGCDNQRILMYILGEELPTKTFLFNVEFVKTICELNPIQYSLTENWVHFKTELDTVLSCRLYHNSEYMDTAEIYDVEGVDFEFPEISLETLQKSTIFKQGGSSIVNITLGKNSLKIKSNNDFGWFEDEIQIEYAGKNINFSVSADLIYNILSKTTKCTLDSEKALKFESDNYIYVASCYLI